MKRSSYLSRLANGADSRRLLLPPHLLFRPASPGDAGAFAETDGEAVPDLSAAAPKSNLARPRAITESDAASPRPLTLRPPNPIGMGREPDAPDPLRQLQSTDLTPEHPALLAPQPGPPAAAVDTSGPMHLAAERPHRSAVGRATAREAASNQAMDVPQSTSAAIPAPAPREHRVVTGRSDSPVPANLVPSPRGERPAAPGRAHERNETPARDGPMLRIGTLQVRINAPPPPVAAKAPPAQATPTRGVPLARGFGAFGLVQG